MVIIKDERKQKRSNNNVGLTVMGFTHEAKFTLWESLTPAPLLTVWDNYSTE